MRVQCSPVQEERVKVEVTLTRVRPKWEGRATSGCRVITLNARVREEKCDVCDEEATLCTKKLNVRRVYEDLRCLSIDSDAAQPEESGEEVLPETEGAKDEACSETGEQPEIIENETEAEDITDEPESEEYAEAEDITDEPESEEYAEAEDITDEPETEECAEDEEAAEEAETEECPESAEAPEAETTDEQRRRAIDEFFSADAEFVFSDAQLERHFERGEDGERVEVDAQDASGHEFIKYDKDGKLLRVVGVIKKGSAHNGSSAK